MKYLFITLDAIMQFVALRQFQTADYNESELLCSILKGESVRWKIKTHDKIKFQELSNGCVFYTDQINKNNGILFDYETFDAFVTNSNDKTITIFQKTLKYAMRYFNRLPLTTCEKMISGTDTTIVFPYPFVATKDVYKILIDRNSSKIDRKGKNILTVFYSGVAENGSKVLFTNLNKAIEDLKTIDLNITKDDNEVTNDEQYALGITDLEQIDLSIDSKIGFSNWNLYLTDKQKKFINSEISGPERLEGAAGTGKTLTMILRCINILKNKNNSGGNYQIAFITHSLSTKNQIIEIFRNNFRDTDNYINNNNLLVTTLQEWCIKYLGAYVADTEYLDRDAKDSKVLQLLYIEQAFSFAIQNDFNSYKPICSREFVDFIEKTDREALIEMLQYEIAVTIKGRANSNLLTYKKLERLTYSIPTKNENDLIFLFLIYTKYQESLESVGQYDSDDIVLTALGQLNTPIWRRRRDKEGFDACFIDETHLFNMNELAVFHYLNSEKTKNNIVFAIDKSQAVGERGILDDTMYDILGISDPKENSHKFNTVFRSSPEIVNLAFNILSSGATLFTNFENPLDHALFNFTEADEQRSMSPSYQLLENDEAMITTAFDEAEKYIKKHKIRKSKVLITTTNDYLFSLIEKFSIENHKPVEFLKSRGDSVTIGEASSSNKFVVGGIDYVGGLEFDMAIIVGVDKGRVPSSDNNSEKESYHFLDYAWHNRMYVAITRAKYYILLLGNKSRGKASMLESAIYYEHIEFHE